MKKIIALILFFILPLFSCQQKVKARDIQKINGYWEIEKVVFPEGEDKVYAINEDYDYFKINSKNEGFRKKVKPQFDGSFLANNIFEKIKIKNQKGVFKLLYKTAYANWEETLFYISDSQMILISKNNIKYHYKKVIPTNILKKDETSKQ